jgi:YHS domain-containing protein
VKIYKVETVMAESPLESGKRKLPFRYTTNTPPSGSDQEQESGELPLSGSVLKRRDVKNPGVGETNKLPWDNEPPGKEKEAKTRNLIETDEIPEEIKNRRKVRLMTSKEMTEEDGQTDKNLFKTKDLDEDTDADKGDINATFVGSIAEENKGDVVKSEEIQEPPAEPQQEVGNGTGEPENSVETESVPEAEKVEEKTEEADKNTEDAKSETGDDRISEQAKTGISEEPQKDEESQENLSREEDIETGDDKTSDQELPGDEDENELPEEEILDIPGEKSPKKSIEDVIRKKSSRRLEVSEDNTDNSERKIIALLVIGIVLVAAIIASLPAIIPNLSNVMSGRPPAIDVSEDTDKTDTGSKVIEKNLPPSDTSESATCPVCRVTITKNQAEYRHLVRDTRKMLYFDTEECYKRFLKDQDLFLDRRDEVDVRIKIKIEEKPSPAETQPYYYDDVLIEDIPIRNKYSAPKSGEDVLIEDIPARVPPAPEKVPDDPGTSRPGEPPAPINIDKYDLNFDFQSVPIRSLERKSNTDSLV